MKLGLYEHYKGKRYQVVGVARHTESLEEVVVYQSLYGDYSLWVRPAAMFQEDVIIEGVKQPRFKYLGELCTTGAVLN
tara:strand:+ start:91273 stop:91506 length:234 start_codon:yes stop_codon:yes gene_type:complete